MTNDLAAPPQFSFRVRGNNLPNVGGNERKEESAKRESGGGGVAAPLFAKKEEEEGLKKRNIFFLFPASNIYGLLFPLSLAEKERKLISGGGQRFLFFLYIFET